MMKCSYCDKPFPLPKLRFINDGMVPGINMKKHRAQCQGCMKKPETIVIDGGEPSV